MGNIRFFGLLDFYPNKEELKEEYEELSLDEKIVYKKEVYSLCFEREYVKDLIWEYLNGWDESQFNLTKEWTNKKKKVEQRLKYENVEEVNEYVDSN